MRIVQEMQVEASPQAASQGDPVAVLTRHVEREDGAILALIALDHHIGAHQVTLTTP
jgi:hypothetical protein